MGDFLCGDHLFFVLQIVASLSKCLALKDGKLKLLKKSIKNADYMFIGNDKKKAF